MLLPEKRLYMKNRLVLSTLSDKAIFIIGSPLVTLRRRLFNYSPQAAVVPQRFS